MKTNFDMTLYELQAEISKTLAHPLRIAILHYLKDGEKTVNDLTEHFGCKPIKHFPASSVTEAKTNCQDQKRRLNSLLPSCKPQN